MKSMSMAVPHDSVAGVGTMLAVAVSAGMGHQARGVPESLANGMKDSGFSSVGLQSSTKPASVPGMAASSPRPTLGALASGGWCVFRVGFM